MNLSTSTRQPTYPGGRTLLGVLTLTAALLLLTGCAGLSPTDRFAHLPVVEYPDTPPSGEYIYHLPAGKPIEIRVLLEGSALVQGVEQRIEAKLARDLYLYQQWASEDRRNWYEMSRLIGMEFDLKLPSWEYPGPGSIRLGVERKDP